MEEHTLSFISKGEEAFLKFSKKCFFPLSNVFDP